MTEAQPRRPAVRADVKRPCAVCKRAIVLRGATRYVFRAGKFVCNPCTVAGWSP